MKGDERSVSSDLANASESPNVQDGRKEENG